MSRVAVKGLCLLGLLSVCSLYFVFTHVKLPDAALEFASHKLEPKHRPKLASHVGNQQEVDIDNSDFLLHVGESRTDQIVAEFKVPLTEPLLASDPSELNIDNDTLLLQSDKASQAQTVAEVIPISPSLSLAPVLVTNKCLAKVKRLVDGKWIYDAEFKPFAPSVARPFDENFQHNKAKDLRGSQGLFVAASQHFAMCMIEKNACAPWSRVLLKVYFNNTKYGDDTRQGPPFRLALNSFKETSFANINNLFFSDPKAVKAVFIRDPLARFLSVFLDKCFIDGCQNQFCAARPSWKQGKTISFSKALEWLIAQDVSLLDPHYAPQAFKCELQSRLDEFNFIGVVNKDTLANDAACLMDLAGLSSYNVNMTSNEPFWSTPKKNAPNGHVFSGSANSEEEMLKHFYTKESASRLWKFMQADVDLFSLEIPSWVEHATGDLADSAAATCVRPLLGNRNGK